jgi:hypothetical protein
VQVCQGFVEGDVPGEDARAWTTELDTCKCVLFRGLVVGELHKGCSELARDLRGSFLLLLFLACVLPLKVFLTFAVGLGLVSLPLLILFVFLHAQAELSLPISFSLSILSSLLANGISALVLWQDLCHSLELVVLLQHLQLTIFF